jgi:hypothetical protein
MRCELLHFGSDGRVVVPPVLLSNMHNLSENEEESCRVIVLKNLSGMLRHRNNESLYISVVIHLLNAAKVLGRVSIFLSEILGVPLLENHLISVSPTSSFSVRKASGTTTMLNYSDIIELNVGEVNSPTAPFSDADIR